MVLGRNFGQIMFNVVKKVKKQALSLGFFSYFVEYLLKQKVVVAKPPECKFKVGVQVGSKKKKKKFFFVPATFLSTQFCLKAKLLTAIVS